MGRKPALPLSRQNRLFPFLPLPTRKPPANNICPGRPLPPPLPLPSLPANRPPTPSLNLSTRDPPHNPIDPLPPALLAPIPPRSHPSDPLRLPPNRLPRAPPLPLPPPSPPLLFLWPNTLPHHPPPNLNRRSRALKRREVWGHTTRRRVNLLRKDNRRPLRLPMHVLLRAGRLRDRASRPRMRRPIPRPNNHRDPLAHPAPPMPHRVRARPKP
jgi:hypothetical protein